MIKLLVMDADLNIAQTSSRPSFSKLFSIKSLSSRDILIFTATFIVLVGALITVIQLQPAFEQLHLERINTFWGRLLVYVSIALLAFKISFLGFIFFLRLKYRPVQSVSNEKLPVLTVIVPAYNEGKLVWKTLHSLAGSHYPEHKVQIISIDDGSQDDTWAWMQKAKRELGDRLSIFQQPKNMGKRHALYRGFKLGTGDVFVTVDSDSIVKTDTLRNLVSPFTIDSKCGAVAGNVRVLNNEKAMIPRMLNVSFAFSFEFIRSAQSQLGSVLCTPGALAAYRRDAVLNCLEDWMHQTFMGKTTDIGEDRAMTNMILKQGMHVRFQSNAVVLTNIPERYKNLYKMFIRWERSNVRENIKMSKFAFTNYREESKVGPRILLLNQWIKVVFAYPFMILMLIFIVLYPVLFISSTLVSILVFSSIPALFYAKSYNVGESLWMYCYSLFYTFSLFWITPYAIATASRRGWLTRDLPKKV
jgi:hyaluronan synthase